MPIIRKSNQTMQAFLSGVMIIMYYNTIMAMGSCQLIPPSNIWWIISVIGGSLDCFAMFTGSSSSGKISD